MKPFGFIVTLFFLSFKKNYAHRSPAGYHKSRETPIACYPELQDPIVKGMRIVRGMNTRNGIRE